MKKSFIFAFIPMFYAGISNAETIGVWDLNGNLKDSSGYSHDGESFNSIGNNNSEQLTPTFVNQPVGQNQESYQFNNSNYIALDMFMNEKAGLDAFSVTVNFKTQEDNTSSEWTNWSFLDFDRSEYFNVFLTGNGNVGFSTLSINDSNGIKIGNDMYSVTSGLNDGLWHSLTVSYGEKNGKSIYVDNQFDSSLDYLGSIGSGVVRYGFIGDGSEATSYNGLRNGIYYDGELANVTFSDHEVGMSFDGTFLNITESDVPVPFAITGLSLMLLCFNRMRRI